MRDWVEVAPGGVSVFWKNFKMLVLRFVAGVLALDGVEAFFTYEPAMANEGTNEIRYQASGYIGEVVDY